MPPKRRQTNKRKVEATEGGSALLSKQSRPNSHESDGGISRPQDAQDQDKHADTEDTAVEEDNGSNTVPEVSMLPEPEKEMGDKVGSPFSVGVELCEKAHEDQADNDSSELQNGRDDNGDVGAEKVNPVETPAPIQGDEPGQQGDDSHVNGEQQLALDPSSSGMDGSKADELPHASEKESDSTLLSEFEEFETDRERKKFYKKKMRKLEKEVDGLKSELQDTQEQLWASQACVSEKESKKKAYKKTIRKLEKEIVELKSDTNVEKGSKDNSKLIKKLEREAEGLKSEIEASKEQLRSALLGQEVLKAKLAVMQKSMASRDNQMLQIYRKGYLQVLAEYDTKPWQDILLREPDLRQGIKNGAKLFRHRSICVRASESEVILERCNSFFTFVQGMATIIFNRKLQFHSIRGSAKLAAPTISLPEACRDDFIELVVKLAGRSYDTIFQKRAVTAEEAATMALSKVMSKLRATALADGTAPPKPKAARKKGGKKKVESEKNAEEQVGGSEEDEDSSVDQSTAPELEATQ